MLREQVFHRTPFAGFVSRWWSLRQTQRSFSSKKIPLANMFVRKLTANNKRCIVARSPRFREQYFIRQKNNFVPYLSCSRIVYSGLNENDENEQ